jgi:DNA-binding transcriptional ArsR family regulator
MMADEGEVSTVVSLLADEYARTILRASREDPQSVEALAEACGADPSTVYRRVERLSDAGLLTEEQRLDPGGHHYKVYAASLREARVSLDEDGFSVDVERAEEEPADRFTRLYEGFK